MSDHSSDLVLWLFVLNLGIAFGAGLYEARIVLPQWLSRDNEGERHWDAWAARRANVGLRFWAGVTTVPLTLLTVASFVAAWATPADVRGWWLFAAAAADPVLRANPDAAVG